VKRDTRKLWTLAVVAGACVLAVIVGLILAGVLVLPGAPAPAPVTVTQADFTIQQGDNSSGGPWFGPSNFSYSGAANGFPYEVEPGTVFTIAVSLYNHDNQSHTISSIFAAYPFRVTGTDPSTPQLVPALEDDALFDVSILVPDTAATSYVVALTISALG
jgi:hypothetical protein